MRRSAAFTACAIIGAAVFLAPGPNPNLRSAIALHDLGHVVAFGLVAALIAFALSAPSRSTFQRRAAVTCIAAGAALGFGAAIELAQAFAGLHGDLGDVVRNAGGAVAVALMIVALDSAISGRARAALAGTGIFVLAAFAYPLFAALRDEARARDQFPVLASFETASELSRFHFGEGMNPRIILTTGEDGQDIPALHLRLPPGKYPGFELRYFPGNWHGMRALKLVIVNPEPAPAEMTVRIDDSEYRSSLDDRYNRAFPLAPGVNRIEIALSDVATAPRDRQFDLRRVHSLLVYAVDLERPRSMIIGPIRLLP
jgi:hypothetical protein